MNGHFEEMQREVVRMFGPISSGLTFAGITFHENGPQTVPIFSHSQVKIILSLNCYNADVSSFNAEELIFELSHETCHLLSPTSWQCVTWLEEGMAVYFSVYYHKIAFPQSQYAERSIRLEGNKKYLEAYHLVKELIEQFPSTIKYIRSFTPQISKITYDDFRRVNSVHPTEKVEKLLSPFN